MAYAMPTKYYEHNLVFDRDNSCWAVYKIQGENYDYLSHDLKKILRNKFARLLVNAGLEYKLLLLPFNKSIDGHYSKLKKRMKGPLKELALEYCDGTCEYLKHKKSVEGNKYRLFLLVKFKKVRSEAFKGKDFAKNLVKNPIRAINEVMNLAAPEIFEYEMNAYLELERKLYSRLNRWANLEREYEYTTQYLIRRSLYRSISEPPMRGDSEDKFKIIDIDGKKLKKKYKEVYRPKKNRVNINGKVAIRPYERDILTLAEGEFDNKPRHIEIKQIIDGEEKTSYQAFLPISYIPDNKLIFPGVEYLYLLQDMYFPVEVMIHVQMLSNEESLETVTKSL